MNEFLGLEGKAAVVAGGASGLGQAVARGLVRERARVVLGDRDSAGLERMAAELGGQARVKRTDVTRLDDIAALFAVCDEAFGPVEILVTCAGIISSMSLAEMTEAEWDRVLAVNTKGTFFCIQEAVKRMIPRKRGRIITIGSDSADQLSSRLASPRGRRSTRTAGAAASLPRPTPRRRAPWWHSPATSPAISWGRASASTASTPGPSTRPCTPPSPRSSGRASPAVFPWAGWRSRRRSEERRVGKECRSRWSPYH